MLYNSFFVRYVRTDKYRKLLIDWKAYDGVDIYGNSFTIDYNNAVLFDTYTYVYAYD